MANNIFIEFLPPWIETGVQPAFYDKESGTVLQQVARIYAKVNQLIESFNDLSKNTTELIEEYITKFTELHDYVYDYFDNLDVQEEINNKIDDMVDAGTLQTLFTGNGLEIGEDHKVKVKAGAGITVDSNGVSETPYENYIDVEVHKIRYTDELSGANTLVTYSIIPNTYHLKMCMSDPEDPNVRKTASEIDYIYKPTIMTNMSPWDVSNNITYGPLIIDNEVKVQNNLGSGTIWNRPLVTVDDEGIMRTVDGSTPADEVTAKYASRAWYTFINNGITAPDVEDHSAREPRTFIAQDYDGNYLIAVCGGRQAEDTGMNGPDIVTFVTSTLSFNAKVLYSFDGGGSSNFLYHGIRQNRLVEREDRPCPTWLYWTSSTAKHPETFKNQSINNLANVQTEINEDGHIQTKAGMDALDTAGNERITINQGARYMIVNPRTVVYNLNFNITGEGNLASYSDLFKNLPKTDSNYYFMALKHSDYSLVPVYITSMDGVNKSRIRSIRAMEPGTYSIHFAVQCNTQY